MDNNEILNQVKLNFKNQENFSINDMRREYYRIVKENGLESKEWLEHFKEFN